MANARKYSVQGQTAVANPTVTTLVLVATTAIRPMIYDGWLGSSATPADNALLWELQRFTAPGTNTAYVPAPLDPGDPACTATAGVTCTVEPTYTAGKIMLRVALNQRATHKLNLDPMSPIVLPATASNGVGLFTVHASFTGVVDSTIWFAE